VALQRVVDAITDKMADGSLTPGKVVNQGELAAELGVTRHYTLLAVEQLIAAGTLRWTDANSTYTRRAVVCRPD
jgi:DNA-binding GntR family transcriptional regulator